MNAESAAAVASWRYEPPYDIYSVGADELSGLTDPVSRYSTVHRDGQLIAYVCLGAEARVRGVDPAPDTDDLGFGLRPDLTGRGLSGEVLPWLIAALDPVITGHRLRVVILDWNVRSLAAYRRAGFSDAGRHRNENGTFLLLERPTTPNPR